MMVKRTFLCLIILSVILGGCKKNSDTGKFIQVPCPLELPAEILESEKFLFGQMEVPELSDQPNRKTIELSIAIFKCKSDSATQDPIVLSAGGPGLSNIDDFVPQLAGGLGNLFLYNRDVVVIETRGLKYSKPFLHIPELEKIQLSLLGENLSVDETIELYLETLQSAFKKFEDEGVNLSAYNTYEISNEVAYVMEQLGYDKFSFFGTSYGTEIGQYLLMNHTDRIASVVMNGTMDITLGGHHMHTGLISTFEKLFQELQSNPEYSKAYPNLKNKFLDKLGALNQHPEVINIKYWKNNENYNVVLNGNRVALWVFHQMYANTQIQLSLHKIINGDYSEIIANPGLIFPTPEFSMGLNLSVFLSETQNIKPEDIPLESEYIDLITGSSLSLFGPYFWSKAQKVWPVKGAKVPAIKETDVPILLLSGKMDYLCPPEYAKQFAENQKNAYVYIFEDVAHSPVDKGSCAIMMLKEFYENPSKAPDTTCMNNYQHKIILPE